MEFQSRGVSRVFSVVNMEEVMTQDLKERVEEAYNATVALVGKQHIKVMFEVDGIIYSCYPTRLGRKIKELTERESKFEEALKCINDKEAGLESELDIVITQILNATNLDKLKEITLRNFPEYRNNKGK